MKNIILLAFSLLTVSCNLQPVNPAATIKDRLVVGSTLRLSQDLVIPKNRSFIYIANGKVAPLKDYNTVDNYKPYCMLFLRDETSHEKNISSDTFEVTGVLEWEGYYSRLDFMNTLNRVGAAEKLVKVGGDRGDIMYATIISLRSKKQPEVEKIVCGHWDDYTFIEPLTFTQLESTLGNLFTIDVAKNKKNVGGFI